MRFFLLLANLSIDVNGEYSVRVDNVLLGEGFFEDQAAARALALALEKFVEQKEDDWDDENSIIFVKEVSV